MLPKRKRLSATQVAAILKGGRSASGSLLSMKYMAQLSGFNAVVIVPKSLARKAVDRNRLRRAVYRALYPLLPPRAGQSGIQALFFVRKVPPLPLTPAFAADLATVLAKLPQV
jgi:ribonuclease P protein component